MPIGTTAWLLAFLAASAVLAAEPRELLRQLSKEQKIIERALRDGNLEAATSAITAIGKLDSPKGIQYLLSLAQVQPPDLYQVVVASLPGTRSPEILATLLAAFHAQALEKEGAWQRRIMLLDAFATTDSSEALAAFSAAINDPHPKVRLAAIRGLSRLTSQPTQKISLWVSSLLASEKAFDIGTPHLEARELLFQSTGQDYRNAAEWQGYWKKQSDGFKPPEVVPDRDVESDSEVNYYGANVSSRRILFIIDTSASMNIFEHEGWPNTPNVPWGAVSSGISGVDNGGSQITNPLWKQWIAANPLCIRMERAKAEISHLLDTLPADTCFNIICFGSRPTAWQNTLIPAQPAQIHNAKAFVATLGPNGATAADLALAMAFETSYLADTIYFLSDGEPSRDGVVPLPLPTILNQVDLANRFPRIIIHTLGFGVGGEPFMKEMARRNRGEYKRIVGPPNWDRD